jgi:hypothetical protein
MMRLKPILAALTLLLLAAPVAQAASPFDLAERIDQRLRQSVEEAQQAETPAQKRLLLSEAFRSINASLDRVKRLPGLPDGTEAALADLQHDVMQKHDRLNGLNGFSPVPDADLDRFGSDVQTSLDVLNRPITITVGLAIVIALLLILLL